MAIILCGILIIFEAVTGLITAFDIKADVLVSLALIASVIIGEDFAAGEVAFIMQLGALLEDLTVAKARAGIEKLIHLTPQTARVIRSAGETDSQMMWNLMIQPAAPHLGKRSYPPKRYRWEIFSGCCREKLSLWTGS